MIVFVTGGHGALGREVIKQFPKSLSPSKEELDIRNRDAVYNFIEINKPEMIIHCAALTSILPCENNRDLAWETNVTGTRNLVTACLEYNVKCYFIYISTACVFYGDRGSYSEDDIPCPKNFYALTKLLGEFTVSESPLKDKLVIRTNFVPKQEWRYPKAFIDRFGTYLFAEDVARGIKEVTDRKLTGIVHICGDRKISMHDLARMTSPDVEPMTLIEYSGTPLTIDMTLTTNRWKKYTISSVANAGHK